MRGPNETNKTNVSGVSRLALPRDSENTTPAKTPNRLHRITPVQVRPVRPYFCAEEEWVVMTSARQGSVLFFSPNRYGLGFSPPEKGGPRWLDGWAAAHQTVLVWGIKPMFRGSPGSHSPETLILFGPYMVLGSKTSKHWDLSWYWDSGVRKC